MTLDDQIGRVLGGRYRLVAPIGSGGSAQVFLADDTTLRRRVAVKMLHQGLAADETFLRRFRAEAQAAAAMNHPHIMAVFDWGEDDVPYLVSEYLGGGSLRAMLDADHRLSVSQALLVGLEAARGLEYAHRQKVIHRDIKPANLLFDDEGRLRIADFGIARALAEAGWTEEGTMVGTVRYASPEQAKSDPLTGKSDVYALGLVLIEAVTGEAPFGADTPISTLVARIDQQVPVPDELGPLRGILERAGRPDPDDRPDAGEFIIGLMAAAEECERPEPLPLVGAIPKAAADPEGAPIDRTEVAIAPVLAPPAPLAPPASLTPPDPTVATPAAAPTRVFQREEREPQSRVAAPTSPPSPYGSVDPSYRDPSYGDADYDDDGHRRRWPWVVLALLLVAAVAGGVIAYFALRTISHEVPDFRNQTVEALRAVADDNNWVVGDEQAVYDPEVAPGLVVRTEPGAGEKLAEEAELRYWVSLGPEPIAIPADLAGKTLDDASAALSAIGLTLGEATPQHHEEIPPDHIIGVNTTETQLLPGAPVPVLVSAGPAPRVIAAEWIGAPYDAVAAAMQEQRLNPERVEAFHDSVPTGSVIGFKTSDGTQDLAAGAELPRDSAVRVIVSQGPAPRPIPDVVGDTLADATAKLEAAGFKVEATSGPPGTRVRFTDPPAGRERPYGSGVQLFMSPF